MSVLKIGSIRYFTRDGDISKIKVVNVPEIEGGLYSVEFANAGSVQLSVDRILTKKRAKEVASLFLVDKIENVEDALDYWRDLQNRCEEL